MISEYETCKVESLNKTVVLDDPMLNEEERCVDFVETIVDPATDNQAAEYLDELMDCLTDDERYIVCARGGVLSVPARTDEQIASELGLYKSGVKALYQGAIDKIRQAKTGN